MRLPLEAPDQTPFWNHAAGTKEFTHPLDHSRFTRRVAPGAHILDFGCGQGRLCAVLTCIPVDSAQTNLVREFKRILRPGGLLLISDYPLQTDERNLRRYATFAPEFSSYGTFRLPDGAVVRHHRREWLTELLAGFEIEESLELDARTMNGNPARILQLWARSSG
jgi:hypothetical protein